MDFFRVYWTLHKTNFTVVVAVNFLVDICIWSDTTMLQQNTHIWTWICKNTMFKAHELLVRLVMCVLLMHLLTESVITWLITATTAYCIVTKEQLLTNKETRSQGLFDIACVMELINFTELINFNESIFSL